MCGIAGIFAYRAAAPAVDAGELDGIRDAMRARGPDGAGSWLAPDGRVGLAHRRLSIIDLSERGAQPMPSADGKLVIVFNGEIYNYRELRHELGARGWAFRSTSDTEVLLALYAFEREAMFAKLRGMYAFALWDAERRGLLVARDPYGIKPLYVADDGGTVRLASQVKALGTGRVPREVDVGGVAGFYLLGSVPEPLTRYRAVRALRAGSWQWFDERGPGEEREHHSLAAVFRRAVDSGHDAASGAAGGADGGARAIAEALAESVRHHLVADVPVGAFLSAGVDSGALVALMTEAGGPPRTITLGFPEYRGGRWDEVPFAESIAARYGTEHTTHWLGSDEVRDSLGSILAAMDQPSVDGVNSWLVSRAARAAGLKVAVSGLGGDELFGGYETFRSVPRWERAMRVPGRVPRLGRAVERLWGAAGIDQRLPVSPKLGSLLRYGGSFAGAYLLKRGVFMPAELPMLMGAAAAEEGLRRLEPLAHIDAALRPDPEDAYARVAVLEASLYMRNQLLRDTDWASMAHGLEVRVPFVDARLLEQLAPLLCASAGKIRAKELIGAAPRRPLPAEIVHREKSGFFVPLAEVLEDPRAGLDGYKRVPALAHRRCHWARRFAYALAHDGAADA